MKINFLILVAAWSSSVATASPFPDDLIDNSLEDANSGEDGLLEWEGVIFPGGPNVTLTGLVEDIYDQVMAQNPNFLVDFPLDEDVISERSLVKRDRIQCTNAGINSLPDVQRAKEQAQYLVKLGGTCGLAAGRPCIKVSCAYKVGIQFCRYQNRPGRLTAPCKNLGNHAFDVIHECASPNLPVTGGRKWINEPHTHSVWVRKFSDCST